MQRFSTKILLEMLNEHCVGENNYIFLMESKEIFGETRIFSRETKFSRPP